MIRVYPTRLFGSGTRTTRCGSLAASSVQPRSMLSGRDSKPNGCGYVQHLVVPPQLSRHTLYCSALRYIKLSRITAQVSWHFR